MNQMTQLDAGQLDANDLANSAITARVIAIIADQAMIDLADISADTALADLNLDSLVMVEIVFALEEAFDVTVPFNANTGEAAFDMSTPAAIAAALISAAASPREAPSAA